MVNGVRDYRVEDGHVPHPKLIQMMAISVCGGSLNESRFESCHEEVGVHFAKHAIYVSSHNDFG